MFELLAQTPKQSTRERGRAMENTHSPLIWMALISTALGKTFNCINLKKNDYCLLRVREGISLTLTVQNVANVLSLILINIKLDYLMYLCNVNLCEIIHIKICIISQKLQGLPSCLILYFFLSKQ